MRSVNPATGQVIESFEELSEGQLEEKLARAQAAYERHRRTALAERAGKLARAAEILEADAQALGEIMTREMGKPIGAAVAEARKCALACRYYAENGERELADLEIATDAERSFVRYLPIGPVLAIMPWNFPYWQAFRFGIPAIAAGNVVLLKHASNVPETALSIEEAFTAAGFPANVFKTLIIDSKEALKLIDDDKVDAVSLTGSNKAGEEVGAHAGRKIKKVVLELGGSDPFIVLDDADIEKAGRMAANARTLNAGQSCIAAKRFIIMEPVAEEFKKHFISRLKELKVGDPMDEKTDIGPVARKDILDSLNDQLRDAKAKGAEVIQLDNSFKKGLFFPPAVVYNPKKNSKVLTEEVFGPIAPIITVKDEDEAVQIANDTEYGLGCSIWSRNTDRAERLAARIETGTVAINDMVKSDPRLPFGGVKKSGIGRELSHFGLREFVNVKTVAVRE